jgi:tRNA dimethylallyltransferase
MATEAMNLPLAVIVGPTASGKTSLAIELAKKFDGEIICADSRTVYKGMDIGTAKPTTREQHEVPHWGLDLVEPNQRFTAADFQVYATEKIQEIRQRGHIPFLVGGTGLYIDAVLFQYEFSLSYEPDERLDLETKSIKELLEYCIKNNIKLPENVKNKRHLVRAIEQKSINTKRKAEPINPSIIVGIATNREMLRSRIQSRAEQLFDDGVVSEATILGEKYGWQSEAMTGNIYPLVHSYLKGESTIEEIKQKFIVKDWQLAKRQLTWFKRNPFIVWGTLEQSKTYLIDVLASEQQS